MLKKTTNILAVWLLILSLLIGCSSKTASSSKIQTMTGQKQATTAKTDGKKEKNATPAPTQAANESKPNVNAIIAQRNTIRNASISIEVESYEQTYGKVQTMVENSGLGYIQQSNETKHGSSGKSGVLVVRVDGNKFSQVLNKIKALGEVLEANETTDDVTEKFFDTDSELRLLKQEQSRLEKYLKSVPDTDSVIKTESRLTEIKHQIETYTGTLNKLSALAKLSTITIDISEKSTEKVPDPTVKEKSYWEKLFDEFINSIHSFVNLIGRIILLVVRFLPGLVLLGGFGWIVRILYKKKRIKDSPAKEAEAIENEESEDKEVK